MTRRRERRRSGTVTRLLFGLALLTGWPSLGGETSWAAADPAPAAIASAPTPCVPPTVTAGGRPRTATSKPPATTPMTGQPIHQQVTVQCGNPSAGTLEADLRGEKTIGTPLPPAPQLPQLGTSGGRGGGSGTTTSSGSTGSDFGEAPRACPPSKFDIKFRDISLGISTTNSGQAWVALAAAVGSLAAVLGFGLFAVKKATSGTPFALMVIGALLLLVIGGAIGWAVRGGNEQQKVIDQLNAAKISVDQQIGDRLANCEARNLQLEATQETMRSIWPVLAQRVGPLQPVPVADRGAAVPVAVAGANDDDRPASITVVMVVFLVVLLVALLTGVVMLGVTERSRHAATVEVRDLLKRSVGPVAYPAAARTPPAPPPG